MLASPILFLSYKKRYSDKIAFLILLTIINLMQIHSVIKLRWSKIIL